MSDKIDTRVIQVTNLAPTCTKEQLNTLFSYLGQIKELQMYPPESVDINAVTVRVAYIEFEDTTTTGVALHLNSCVFVDRALVIVPVMDGKIPDETTAMRLTPQAVAGMLPGQPTWPANVVSQMTGTGTNQVITTFDPKLTSLGLPQYPPLPASTDQNVVEEIRRTVYVSNLDLKVTGEMLITFFSQAGEVKYVRMAGDDAAYVEFTDQRSVAQALSRDGEIFHGQPMGICHSMSQIIKPQDKSTRSPSRSKRSRSKSKGRSRSRSKRRSRSRSKGRRRKSRSRSRRRSRSRHRSPRRSRSPRRRRSRSRGRVLPPALSAGGRRSRSRDRRRSRTRSPVGRRRRSRSVSKKRRSRTPPKSYSSKRSRSRSRKRSVSRSRKRSRSRDRKLKDKKKSPSLSPPRLERNGSIPPKDGSPGRRDSSPKPEGPAEEKTARSVSPGPSRPRRRSPSPRKRSRSRSPRRIKRRRRTRSPSLRKRSRSRSGSRHRSKRDRGKRSRSRDRKHDSKRKSTRDRDRDDKRKDSSSMKVKRDYDEEEKGYASAGSEKDQGGGGSSVTSLDYLPGASGGSFGMGGGGSGLGDSVSGGGGDRSDDSSRSGRDSPPPRLDTMEREEEEGTNHQTVDMDMSD